MELGTELSSGVTSWVVWIDGRGWLKMSSKVRGAASVEIVWCDVCCVTHCDVCWVSLCDVSWVTFCDVCSVIRFDVWDRLMISFMARAAFSADIAGRRRRPLWRLLLRYFIFGPVRMFWKLRLYNLLTTFLLLTFCNLVKIRNDSYSEVCWIGNLKAS